MSDQLREILGSYAHSAWSSWMEYLFEKSVRNADGSVTIPKELVARWKRQSMTSFESLPEEEKNSDRHEADKMLRVFSGQKVDEVQKMLTDLYQREINWSLSCFFDGGYQVELGDPLNGFKAGGSCFETLAEAVKWLYEQACEYYNLESEE